MIPGDSACAGGLGRSELDASASGLRGETGQENSTKPDKTLRMSQPQKPKEQNRDSVEYLDKQKEVKPKIELFSPTVNSDKR
jgi:hypothetical protein